LQRSAGPAFYQVISAASRSWARGTSNAQCCVVDELYKDPSSRAGAEPGRGAEGTGTSHSGNATCRRPASQVRWRSWLGV